MLTLAEVKLLLTQIEDTGRYPDNASVLLLQLFTARTAWLLRVPVARLRAHSTAAMHTQPVPPGTPPADPFSPSPLCRVFAKTKEYVSTFSRFDGAEMATAART